MTPIRESTFYFKNMISYKHVNNLEKLGVEATYLLNITRVGEDLAIGGFEPMSAWSEHLHDDTWSSPWWRPWEADACAAPRGDRRSWQHHPA
jgi:hypothetical protein